TGATHGRVRLLNATSCKACHSDGGGGAGPAGDGVLPAALIIQLESPSADHESAGDPVYGHVFNTSAVDGGEPEGVASVRYSEIEGHYYPEGLHWRMRVPHYRLTNLSRGPLAGTTVIKPRLAPALYGVALLEAVPESAITQTTAGPKAPANAGEPSWRIYDGRVALGRFGWQGGAISIRDQTTRAFAREMGLTSPDQPHDDCTVAETDCWQRNSVAPEISENSVAAVLAYLRSVRVPPSQLNPDEYASGLGLFTELGCAACHRSELPADSTQRVITPYTDLRLHDLGIELADQTVSGARVVSKWRTAPLWGLGYRVRSQTHPTFLHDGRARTLEEAVLWHSGEAAKARHEFVSLFTRRREALLRWLESL
ncbi:MAG TPA: di-heme oxidoredictase family protein, partial [Steroidobacteraceae bacterium]